VSLPADANYPFGRYSNHTVSAKDDWVRDNTNRIIQEQIALETAPITASSPLNEISLGADGGLHKSKAEIKARRFYQNPDCQDAFKRYMCWINFPRCDDVFEDTSLPICQSACENFFRTCGYPYEMHVCPLDTESTSSKPLFPGAPFHKNEYIPRTEADPRVVCTPSIKGAAIHPIVKIAISTLLMSSLILSLFC